jgi:hypothetical protein
VCTENLIRVDEVMGVVSESSLVSRTKTASSFAGWVLLAFYFIELSRNDDVYSHPLLLSKHSLIRSNFLCFQPLERLVFSRGVGCSMSRSRQPASDEGSKAQPSRYTRCANVSLGESF